MNHVPESLRDLYPDIERRRVGRWLKDLLVAKSVNGLVDHCGLRHNCGCCDDSPLEVWPYLETPHGRVSTDPPYFTVGDQTCDGDEPRANWEVAMREAGVSDAVIDIVAKHFADTGTRRGE